MQLADLPIGAPRVLRLAADRGALPDMRPGVEIELEQAGASDVILARIDGQVCAVRGVERSDQRHLEEVASSGAARIGWVLARFPKLGTPADLTISVVELPVRISWAQPTDVAVDERALERIRVTTGERRLDIDAALAWLAEEYLLPPVPGHDEARAVVALPPSERSEPGALRFLGVRSAMDVELDHDGRLTVRRVRDGHGQLRDAWRLGLVTGAIGFRDATVAGKLTTLVRAQLEQLAARGGKYLSMWSAYHEREVARLEDQARELGTIPYHGAQKLSGGGWRFAVRQGEDDPAAKLWEVADQDIELEAIARADVDASPVAVTLDGAEEQLAPARWGQRDVFVGRLNTRALRAGLVELTPMNPGRTATPPASGILQLSRQGNETMLKRRRRALEKIRASNTPMRQLGLLLENLTAPSARRKRIDPHSARVERVVGGTLTEQQRRALDVALNTPDIAVIQGPPGTGKTRVIAALQQRLAEEANQSARLTGRVLLTSFQHEAVENAIASAQVFGLPAIKIGESRRARVTARPMEVWRTQQVNRVQSSLQAMGFEVADVHRRVRILARAYSTRPGSRQESQQLLEQVLDIARDHLSPGLQERLRQRIRALGLESRHDAAGDAQSLAAAARFVRAIRTRADTFADDGPQTARRAAQWLLDLGLTEIEDDVALLRHAARRDELDAEALTSLAQAQGRLLDRLLAPADAPPVVDGAVEELLNAATQELSNAVRGGPAGLPRALAGYLEDLETDASLVRSTLVKYCTVVAATCQQAGGRLVHEFTGESEFETVIVDEAARANPLDLFIPMTLGKDRIILVGDHRQLPHLIEQELERELENRMPDLQAEWRKSLFERLFKGVLREMQAKDGIPRIVTLDTQFRMHPTLGRFVSESFYELGEDEDRVVLKPGRAVADFVHELPRYAGRVAGWMDVPFTEGPERSGVSKYRPAEARRTAEELKQLMDDPASEGLTFGVISFYRRQVTELEIALLEIGVAERVAGRTRYRAPYRELTRADGLPVERLRVGTVDEFQGREFDVVFLSMTRSNGVVADDPRALRQKYGHLVLPNRMCVAMSRQKRLLVVAGDSGMLRHRSAEKVIPALVNFRRLCESEEGTVV
jgi:hypothetical protein